VTGIANLGFLFIVLSGIYLWWPRHWTRRTLRSVTLFRRGLRSKARDFNWHNVIGLWCWAPLVVVVASGVMISYAWANRLVYGAFGERPPAVAPAGAPGSAAGGAPGATSTAAMGAPSADSPAATPSLTGIDPLVARAGARMPGWRSLTLTIPRSAAAPATFTLDGGMGGEPQKARRASARPRDRARGAVAAVLRVDARTPSAERPALRAHRRSARPRRADDRRHRDARRRVPRLHRARACRSALPEMDARRRRRFGADGATRRVAVRA
jgi:uncharacterized iron-regulated membrane protein